VPVIRWLAAPGLWLQRLTTRQPDDRQVQVAIAALQAVLLAERETPETIAVSAHGQAAS
jgi:uncharacterized protein YqhQ